MVPEFNLQSEKQLKRKRVISDEEFYSLLSKLARHWQRPVIGLNETAMRVNELLKLTLVKIDEKAALIRLKATDVKEKMPRVVPISPPLQAVLDELKLERKESKIANFSQRVFTDQHGKPIKTIRRAFELARKKAALRIAICTTSSTLRLPAGQWLAFRQVRSWRQLGIIRLKCTTVMSM